MELRVPALLNCKTMRKMIESRVGIVAVCVTKVKGHADEDMVQVGRVRELDQLGNAADEAADFGRRRVRDHRYQA